MALVASTPAISILASAHHIAEGCDQTRSGALQLFMMVQRQFLQHTLAFRCKREQDLASVILGALALDISTVFQSVYQLYRTVMLDLHPVRQFANPWPHAFGNALDRQHHLILAALQASTLDCAFAEVEELSNLVPKLG